MWVLRPVAVVLVWLWVAEGSKFTIEEIQTRRFLNKISDDIYLDPCKAGEDRCLCVCVLPG